MSLGEGIHCAFRKAVDTKDAMKIWTLIKKMPDEDWGKILEFVQECLGGIIEDEYKKALLKQKRSQSKKEKMV